MTREEIEKAYKDEGIRVWMFGDKAVIDFALEMVRRHNEEVLQRVKTAIAMDARENILETIREAKP